MISNNVLKGFSFFCVAALLACLGHVNVTAAELDRSDFAFVINLAESESHQPSLWLLGRYKAGIELTLLLSEPPYICAAKTTSRRAKMDSSQSDLTKVASTCKISKQPRIAVIKKPVIDFKPVALNAINDKKQILSYRPCC